MLQSKKAQTEKAIARLKTTAINLYYQIITGKSPDIKGMNDRYTYLKNELVSRMIDLEVINELIKRESNDQTS